jgi:hypothetical protein
MTRLRQILNPLVTGVACLGAGYVAFATVIGMGMFSSTFGFSVAALVIVVAGAWFCRYVAFQNPNLWILWPLLFGAPMFASGMLVEFSPPHQREAILWKTLVTAILAIFVTAAYYGRTRWRRLIE